MGRRARRASRLTLRQAEARSSRAPTITPFAADNMTSKLSVPLMRPMLQKRIQSLAGAYQTRLSFGVSERAYDVKRLGVVGAGQMVCRDPYIEYTDAKSAFRG